MQGVLSGRLSSLSWLSKVVLKRLYYYCIISSASSYIAFGALACLLAGEIGEKMLEWSSQKEPYTNSTFRPFGIMTMLAKQAKGELEAFKQVLLVL